MYKAIHLLLATLLLGVHVFNTLLIRGTYRTHHQELIDRTLKMSLSMDKIIISVFAIVFISGSLIVPTYHWHYDTPWISAAYLLLTCTGILWAINAWLKHQALQTKQLKRYWFYAISITIFITLSLVIKDAVTKHTWI